MSIDESEIRDYLESKPLKKNLNPTLSDNANDYDQGSDSSNEKIGQKSSLSRNLYLMERDKKIQFGDKQAIAEYMAEQTEINQRIQQQKQMQLEQYDLDQEEKKRIALESKITEADRIQEKEDLEKLVRKRDKEIANIQDWFNASQEEWEEYINDGHTAQESLVNVLIKTSDKGYWCCGIHRYDRCIPFPDGKFSSSAFTTEQIEKHIKRDVPEEHKAAIIDSINEKYDKLIQERKEKTLEDKDVVFRRELRRIDAIPTRTDGDMRVTKLSKGQKARLREAEEVQNEENRRIYRGLY